MLNLHPFLTGPFLALKPIVSVQKNIRKITQPKTKSMNLIGKTNIAPG